MKPNKVGGSAKSWSALRCDPAPPNTASTRRYDCRNRPISCTTATYSLRLADASACTTRGSTSPPCWPARASASGKSTTAFGSPASCTTISATSTWSKKPCNPSTIRSARGCHPCLRYVVLPMCPGRTISGLAVCGVRYEPVSLLFGQYQGDFRKKQRAGSQKCQKALQHRHFPTSRQFR